MRERRKLEAIQRRIAEKVVLKAARRRITTVGGCDAAYKGTMGSSACALLSYPQLGLLEVSRARAPVDFSYVPGFFAFREVPLLLQALKGLTKQPDCLIVDGHGVAHPRGAGLACHIGVLTGISTIGCAKNPLMGEHVPPGDEKGSLSPLLCGQTRVGYVVRSRSGVRPIYVSPGHLMDDSTAVAIVLACCRAYRIPEPLRIAHIEGRRALIRK